ncbi:MAG: Ldh family oxidoreductase [Paracoccus sp. (in: a-proteobacteria)]|nr:Ldh family oxidoreductase [Paracoccus sp. (in: a-proteobacteria)]
MDEAVARLSVSLGGGPAAMLAATALIEAEALGKPRFGLDMLNEWAPDAAAFPSGDGHQPVRWVDCTSCFAPLAVAHATLELAQAAQRFGIAAIFLRGVRGFGRFAPFLRHLADAGLVGLAGAEGPPFVAAHGGAQPVIGTNPVAFAMGTGAGRVIIDMATSTATMADIRDARDTGAPLPDGIALDAGGRATRIAAEVAALLPRGGRTGSLLGLIVELLAGVAGGGRDDPQGRGVFLLAFAPPAAGDAIDWQARLADLRRDWLDGGGHWPGGGGPAPDTRLDRDFTRRLDARLAHMATKGAS